MTNILIVDDDQDARESLARILRDQNLAADLYLAANAQSALEQCQSKSIEVAIVDLCLEQKLGVESGFELIANIRKIKNAPKIIVLTGHGSNQHGVRALQLGASSFLEKPADIEHLTVLCREALSQAQLLRSLDNYKAKVDQAEVDKLIVGISPAAEKLRSEILYAASHKQAVYIYGETGTGKGLCAQSIHLLSKSGINKGGKFIRYQPSVASNAVAASELFGHIKGSFTGALEDRAGLLAKADGGTLFLDEVDELSHDLQVSLLGVLQDKQYRQIGSDNETKSDFRLITASNCKLDEALASGKLRKDFYHRCAHCRIDIPPLRERRVDIPVIVNNHLEQLILSEQVKILDVEKAAMQKLSAYDWPGNIRELLACIEAAAYRARYNDREQILESDLMLSANFENTSTQTLFDQVSEFKRKVCLSALEQNKQNQVHAAKSLGIDRATLRRLLS